jgi:hypothetical protein
LGYSRRGSLNCASRVIVCQSWISPLEEGPECAIERACARLQQQMRAAFGLLHLLALGKALLMTAFTVDSARHEEMRSPVAEAFAIVDTKLAMAAASITARKS